jgi:hypothetical protein
VQKDLPSFKAEDFSRELGPEPLQEQLKTCLRLVDGL